MNYDHLISGGLVSFNDDLINAIHCVVNYKTYKNKMLLFIIFSRGKESCRPCYRCDWSESTKRRRERGKRVPERKRTIRGGQLSNGGKVLGTQIGSVVNGKSNLLRMKEMIFLRYQCLYIDAKVVLSSPPPPISLASSPPTQSAFS